jgi:hypothetical protein
MRRKPLLLATCLCALAGCATDEPEREGTPVIAVSPESIDFGEVSWADETVSREEVTITNEGDADLVLGDVVVAGEGYTLPGLDRSGRILSPGGSIDLIVQLLAERDGERPGRLRIPSNAGEAVVVPVVADVLAPLIDLSPAHHDFGNPVVGCAPTVVVTIANVGREPLVLESVELDGNNEWALESTVKDGRVIDVDDFATVVVRYQPDDPEGDRAELVVRSFVPDQPEAIVSFEGRAHFETEATETFAGGPTRYPLSFGAVWETIRVSIDGRRVFSGWSYDDSEGPTLVFTPSAAPAEGSTVRVVYIALGEC